MRALILIDIQNGLTKARNLCLEKLFFDAINSAIEVYRKSGLKIIFVQHNNNQLQKDTFAWEIDQRVGKLENDWVIQKEHGNAFQDTCLKTILLETGIDQIAVGGLVSHGCVKATCLGGLAEGYDVSLLKNGHTNWNKDAKEKIEQTENELATKRVKILDIALLKESVK
jgi:nicotinamidase-related amidase